VLGLEVAMTEAQEPDLAMAEEEVMVVVTLP